MWDPSGGGDHATSNQVFGTTQGGFKIFAYFDTSDQPQNSNAAGTLFTGSEITIYGVGGGDMLTNLTDLGGNIGMGPARCRPRIVPMASRASTGCTSGLPSAARTGATQTLYLVDANDGGDSDLGGNTPLDWTILQTIDISGLASDWFDLGISIDAAGNGVARFNGTNYTFTTSTALHSGAFNVGYRENLQIGRRRNAGRHDAAGDVYDSGARHTGAGCDRDVFAGSWTTKVASIEDLKFSPQSACRTAGFFYGLATSIRSRPELRRAGNWGRGMASSRELLVFIRHEN